MTGKIAASTSVSDKFTASMTSSNNSLNSHESKHKGSFSLTKTAGFSCVIHASEVSRDAKTTARASVAAFTNEISCIKEVTAYWIETEAKTARLFSAVMGSHNVK